jgi:hypothetical protein
MPPKAGPSKKTVDKAKAKIIEDKTFGLKNKNRSTKVQAYVSQIESSVKHSSADDKKAERLRAEKQAAKEAKIAFEAEMAKMFNVDKKKKEEVPEDDEGLGGNPDDYLWRPEDFDEVEEDTTRLEEKLEAERQELIGRTDLTPVTEETFRAWREKKKAEKIAEERARLEGAKRGATKLRGWDLWQENQALFVDDEDAEVEYEKEFEDAALFEDADGEFDMAPPEDE